MPPFDYIHPSTRGRYVIEFISFDYMPPSFSWVYADGYILIRIHNQCQWCHSLFKKAADAKPIPKYIDLILILVFIFISNNNAKLRPYQTHKTFWLVFIFITSFSLLMTTVNLCYPFY
jgi:hypothetical protein